MSQRAADGRAGSTGRSCGTRRAHSKFGAKFGGAGGEATRSAGRSESSGETPGAGPAAAPPARPGVPRSPPPPGCLRAERLSRAGTEPGRPAEISLKATEPLALFCRRAFLTPLVKAGNRLQGRARSANGPRSQSGLKLYVCAFPSGESRQLPKARFQTRTPFGQRSPARASPARPSPAAQLRHGPGRADSPQPRPRAARRGKPTYLPSRPGHPRSPEPLCASPREVRPWISKRALPS